MTYAYESDSIIDTHKAIAAFQVIAEKGEKKDDGFHYGGLVGETDFDGYTVFLHDDQVSLTVHYKHRFDLDYKQQDHLESFKHKIDALLE